jgi:hypothetical protein
MRYPNHHGMGGKCSLFSEISSCSPVPKKTVPQANAGLLDSRNVSAPNGAPTAPIGWFFQEGIGARIAKVWSLCQEKGCQFGILSETLVPAATRAL